MGEIKQIKISNLKSLNSAFFAYGIILFYFFKFSLHTHYHLKHSKLTKIEEDMGLEFEKGFRANFFKLFETNYHSSSSYVF
jgi:hypothetical protein